MMGGEKVMAESFDPKELIYKIAIGIGIILALQALNIFHFSFSI